MRFPVALAILLFLGALALRLEVWRELAPLPLFRTPQLDSREYVEWATRLAAGDWRWPTPPSHGPGYPLFLAACLRLFGSLDAARVMQAILGAFDCVLVALLTNSFLGTLGGAVAGGVLAVYGPLALTDVSLLAESLLLPLTSAAFLCVTALRKPAARAAGAGAFAGVAALVRPTALVILPLLAIAAGRGARRRALAALFIAITLAAAAFFIVPVTLVNWKTSGDLVFVQGHGGFNFFIGNSPRGTGLPTIRPGAGWDRLESEALRAGYRSPAQQDRYFIGKTWREIAEAPLVYCKLLAGKLLWTFQAEEVRDPFSFYFFANAAPILRWLPGMGLLFPLASLGLVSAVRARLRPGIFFGWFMATALASILLVTSGRYRLPMIIPLAFFAGAGGVILRDSLHSGWRFRTMAAAILVASFALSHIERHAPSHKFAEEWSASGFSLVHERDLDAAQKAFESAVAAEPGWSPAWEGLGVVAFDRGDLEAARRLLGKSVALEPDNLAALSMLGKLLERLQRFAEAEDVYRRAAAIAPDDLPFLEGLARSLLANRKLQEARDRAREAVDRDPANAKCHLLLANVLGALHEARAGAFEASTAAQLEPSNPQIWLTLAMLRLDSGDLEGVETALGEAESLGADERQISLARALLHCARGARGGISRGAGERGRVKP